MKHRRIYNLLKRYGFSPAMALEILIDCRRHQRFAVNVLRLALSARHLKPVTLQGLPA